VKLSDVKWALSFLAEHGFGRPPQTMELHETGPSPQTLEVRAMVRALSKEDLQALLVISKRARQAVAALPRRNALDGLPDSCEGPLTRDAETPKAVPP
jgi:hypothetical protein